MPSFYNLPNGVGPQVPGLPPPSDEHAQFLGPETRYFHVVAEERLHSFDPKIPDTLIWGYRDATVGAWPYGVGPILGGILLAMGGGARRVFWVAAIPALIGTMAALAVAAMRKKGEPE